MDDMNEVQRAIRLHRRMGEVAEKAGVTRSYVSAVYVGKKEPSQKLLDALDLERVVTYRSKAPSKKHKNGER